MPNRLKIYLETSVISYLVAKPSSDPEKALRQAYTLRWMETVAPECELLVSNEVVKEAAKGNPEEVEKRLAVIDALTFVTAVQEEIDFVVTRLRKGHQMFSKKVSDAVHIAISSVAGIDVLLTWNCRHLANEIELPRTESIVRQSGYLCPRIMTPKAHLEERNE